jgi:hypothetical protein
VAVRVIEIKYKETGAAKARRSVDEVTTSERALSKASADAAKRLSEQKRQFADVSEAAKKAAVSYRTQASAAENLGKAYGRLSSKSDQFSRILGAQPSAYAKVFQAQKQVTKETTQLTKEVVKQTPAWSHLSAGIVAAESGVSLLRQGLQAVKTVFDDLKGGAQVRDVARAFEVMGGSAAGLAEMRDNLRGAVSDNQIRRFNNMARALGLTTQQFQALTPIANAASNLLGIDVSYALESVTTGVARQSKLWLDNLGIIVDTEGAYKKAAKALGIKASALDDAQKKQAFFNAVVEAGNRLIKFAPLDGYADAYNRVEAAVGNAGDAVKASLSQAFAPLAEQFAEFIRQNQGGLLRFFDGVAAGMLAIANVVTSYGGAMLDFAKIFFAAKLYQSAATSLQGFVATFGRLPGLVSAASASGLNAANAFVGAFKRGTSAIASTLSVLIRGLGVAGLVISAAISLGEAIGNFIGVGAEKSLSDLTKTVVAKVNEAYAGMGLDMPLSEAVQLQNQRRAGLAVSVGKTEDGIPVLGRVSELEQEYGQQLARQLIQAEIRRNQAALGQLSQDRTVALRANAIRGGGRAGTQEVLGRFGPEERRLKLAIDNLGKAIVQIGADPERGIAGGQKKLTAEERAELRDIRRLISAFSGAYSEAEDATMAQGIAERVQATRRQMIIDQERSPGGRRLEGQAGGIQAFALGTSVQALTMAATEAAKTTAAIEAMMDPLTRLGEIGSGAFNMLADGMGQAAASAIIHGESFSKSIKQLTGAVLESIAVQALSQSAYLAAIGIAMSAGIPIPGLGFFGAAGASAAFASAAALAGVGATAAVAARAFGGGGGPAGQGAARSGAFDTPSSRGLGQSASSAIQNNVTVLVNLPTEPVYGAMAQVNDNNNRSRASAAMVPS